jgi:hypothetical protein
MALPDYLSFENLIYRNTALERCMFFRLHSFLKARLKMDSRSVHVCCDLTKTPQDRAMFQKRRLAVL